MMAGETPGTWNMKGRLVLLEAAHVHSPLATPAAIGAHHVNPLFTTVLKNKLLQPATALLSSFNDSTPKQEENYSENVGIRRLRKTGNTNEHHSILQVYLFRFRP